MQKKFYMIDKLHNWKSWCKVYCSMFGLIQVLIIFILGSVKIFFPPIIFFGVFYLRHLWQMKYPAILFQKNAVFIRWRKYDLSDVQQFWIAQEVLQHIGAGTYPLSRCGRSGLLVQRVLHIKMKSKTMPFYFDLENNFSEKDAKAILAILKSKHIPEKRGNSYSKWLDIIPGLSFCEWIVLFFLI